MNGSINSSASPASKNHAHDAGNLINLIILVLAVFVGLGSAAMWAPSTVTPEGIVPMGHDSFYHARRILDAISEFENYYQFDTYMHAPEGSWVTWPWTYNYLVAVITLALMKVFHFQDPWSVLLFIAPFWLIINMGMLSAIITRLQLDSLSRAIVLFVYALLPLTRGLHGVGMLDHHFIEHFFVLNTLYFGLAWCQNKDSRLSAGLLGITLGIAQGFHNGLFVLQISLLVTCLVAWRYVRFPPRTGFVFAASLVLGTFLVLLPSEPFQAGIFKFYLLSWFHLYIATATALCMIYISCCSFSARNVTVLVLLASVAAVVGLIGQGSGFGFLSLSLEGIRSLREHLSIIRPDQQLGWRSALTWYSGYIVLLPFVYIWGIYKIFRGRHLPELYYCVSLVFGLTFLALIFRFHYYGMIYLV